jgi:hypothetical protein
MRENQGDGDGRERDRKQEKRKHRKKERGMETKMESRRENKWGLRVTWARRKGHPPRLEGRGCVMERAERL